jgi:hypothetical protein
MKIFKNNIIKLHSYYKKTRRRKVKGHTTNKKKPMKGITHLWHSNLSSEYDQN